MDWCIGCAARLHWSHSRCVFGPRYKACETLQVAIIHVHGDARGLVPLDLLELLLHPAPSAHTRSGLKRAVSRSALAGSIPKLWHAPADVAHQERQGRTLRPEQNFVFRNLPRTVEAKEKSRKVVNTDERLSYSEVPGLFR